MPRALLAHCGNPPQVRNSRNWAINQ